MPRCNKMYNHLDFYNPDGSVTPCCHFDKGKTKFGWNSYIPKIKYFEWYDMRERMSEGWIPECHICENQEKLGFESMRQEWNSRSCSSIGIEGIELALDYTCNFMCRMCTPALSTSWRKYDEDWERFDGHFWSPAHNHSSLDYLKTLNLSNLKTARVVGGEPFLSNSLQEFLDILPRGCEIVFDTNGSIFPDQKIVDILLDKFKVQVDISIDAIGDLAECIRFGTIWEEVNKNIDKHFDTWNLVNIHTTISILNVNRINDIYDIWNDRCVMNNLTHPNFLRPEQIPIEQRQSWKIPSLRGVGDFNNLILSDLSVEYEYKKCIDFLKTCDKHQGIKFKDVNSELWEIINGY